MDPDAVAAPLPRESPPRDDDSPDAGDKDGRKRRHKEKRSHKHKSKEKKRSREKSPALPEGPSVGDGEDDGEEGELLPHASPLPSPSPLRYVRAMPLAACVRSWVYRKVCNSGSLQSPTPSPPQVPQEAPLERCVTGPASPCRRPKLPPVPAVSTGRQVRWPKGVMNPSGIWLEFRQQVHAV